MAHSCENLLLRRYIDKAMVDLPSLPNVVVEILDATNAEGTTTSEIERLVSMDQAIVTKLLKVVNSAYFGLPRLVTDVKQVVAILGLHQVRNLVLSIGVLNALESPNPRVASIQTQLWQEAFGSAKIAEMVAGNKKLDKSVSENVYIGGLLHDIGRLFLFTLFRSPYEQVLMESEDRDEPLEVTERRVLGTTHAELGGVLADKWNFPTELIEMIRDHDRPIDSSLPPAVICVAIADKLVGAVVEGEIVGLADSLDEGARLWLGLDSAQIETLGHQASEKVREASEVMGLLAA